MQFIRLVCLNIETPKEDNRSMTLPSSLNDHIIEHLGNHERDGELLSLWKFQKRLLDSDYSLTKERLDIEDDFLDECHRTIRFFASFLSVIYQFKLTISSAF